MSASVQATLKAEAKNLNFYYGDFKALKGISLPVYDKKITALIGPSGCGKSTFLRCFNRMHDLYPGNRYEGEITLNPDNVNILSPKVDPIEVRMRISMVFQKPNPFPKSIYENVAYGLRVRGINKRSILDEKVEEALTNAARHADAQAVELSLQRLGDSVVLEVRDDGRGFDGLEEGSGLMGMRERASLVRAELSVISRPRHGTTVRLKVPVGGAA